MKARIKMGKLDYAVQLLVLLLGKCNLSSIFRRLGSLNSFRHKDFKFLRMQFVFLLFRSGHHIGQKTWAHENLICFSKMKFFLVQE